MLLQQVFPLSDAVHTRCARSYITYANERGWRLAAGCVSARYELLIEAGVTRGYSRLLH